MPIKILVLGLFSLLVIVCKGRPDSVPKEARVEDNRYFLFDSHDGKKDIDHGIKMEN